MRASYPIDDVTYWRDMLFALTMSYVIPLSLIAIIPGIIMSFISDVKGLLIIDSSVIFLLIITAYIPKLSIDWRKRIFSGLVYTVGLALLLFLGYFGPGLLYLLAITTFMILIFNNKYAFVSFFLNLGTCIVFSILLENGLFLELFPSINSDLTVGAWIAVSSNLLFLGAVFSYLIPKLFDGLQNSILSQYRLSQELKVHQDSLAESNRLLQIKNQDLEQFTHTVSHDLQEPLRMISSFMSLLKNKYDDLFDVKAKQYIHFAIDGAKRMRQLIADLLELSLVGKYPQNLEPVDCNLLLRNTLNLMRKTIEESKAKIITLGDLPHLMVHPHSLQLVFQNLLSNALKYRKENVLPKIEISCFSKDQEWQFSVSDNGMGIPLENQEKIFDIFKRLHSRVEYDGTGIGLSIVKKVIENYGGRVWVESVPNEGSSFFFTLPKN
jgi:signal transduction histidine kinase